MANKFEWVRKTQSSSEYEQPKYAMNKQGYSGDTPPPILAIAGIIIAVIFAIILAVKL